MTLDESIEELKKLMMMASVATCIPDESNLGHLSEAISHVRKEIKEHEKQMGAMSSMQCGVCGSFLENKV